MPIHKRHLPAMGGVLTTSPEGFFAAQARFLTPRVVRLEPGAKHRVSKTKSAAIPPVENLLGPSGFAYSCAVAGAQNQNLPFLDGHELPCDVPVEIGHMEQQHFPCEIDEQ